MRNSKKVIYHLPHSIGGNAYGLSRAEKKLGFESSQITFDYSPYKFNADCALFKKNDSRIIKLLKKIRLLFKLMKNADIIHYNFGATLFNVSVSESGRFLRFRQIYNYFTKPFIFWDMKLLSVMKKEIYITYQGDDVRQGDKSLKLFEINVASEVDQFYYPSYLDDLKRSRVKVVEKYASKIFYLNPDLQYFLPKRANFLQYSNVFKNNIYMPSNKKIKIIHAPSNRGSKGTRYILEAVEKLRSKFEFDFELLEGIGNEEVLSKMKEADLLIDQLLYGWYGGVAVEAMSFGVPVIAYIREGDLSVVPEGMRNDIPIVNANKYNISSILEVILEGAVDLISLRRKSYDFVTNWHDPIKIAKKVNEVN